MLRKLSSLASIPSWPTATARARGARSTGPVAFSIDSFAAAKALGSGTFSGESDNESDAARSASASSMSEVSRGGSKYSPILAIGVRRRAAKLSRERAGPS